MAKYHNLYISAAVVEDMFNMRGNRGDFDIFASHNIENFLLEKAAHLAVIATERLNQVDRVSTGALSDSIAPQEPQRVGNSIVVPVDIAFYYKFIDQGVNGYKVNRGSSYNYKPTAPTQKMVDALKIWIKKEGIKQSGNRNKAIVAREKRRKLIPQKIKNLDEAAYALSATIKKVGQKRTLFWTNSLKDIEKDIEKTIGKELTIVITNGLVR